jgi:putative transposase
MAGPTSTCSNAASCSHLDHREWPRTRHWHRGKDQDALLTFYDFPAEHWDHLRTSNPIESVFATVRHRTVRTKGALSQDTARLMVFKLVMTAARTWRRLKGENQLPKVVQGVTFRNGVEVTDTPTQSAA